MARWARLPSALPRAGWFTAAVLISVALTITTCAPPGAPRRRQAIFAAPAAGSLRARRLTVSQESAASQSDVSEDTVRDAVRDVRNFTRGLVIPAVPTLHWCGFACFEVQWLSAGHVLPQIASLHVDEQTQKARLWAFVELCSALCVATSAVLELVNHVYRCRRSAGQRQIVRADEGDGDMAEPLMRTPATPLDQAAGTPPASTSAAEGAPGASVVGAGIADRLFSAFTSFYQGLCWCLAVSAALLGYAGPVTGLDWEIFLVWQGFMILVHSGCVVARLLQGLPPLPTGTITKVVCMSFTPGLSEPLDALRDAIVAVVFLHYGLTVGYLSAALTLLAVISSTIVSLQDTHAFEEHKACSGWALYFLPGEPLADPAHAADHNFAEDEFVMKAGDTPLGAKLLVLNDADAVLKACHEAGLNRTADRNRQACLGEAVIAVDVDTSDDTVKCHVPSLDQDIWFGARALAKQSPEETIDFTITRDHIGDAGFKIMYDPLHVANVDPDSPAYRAGMTEGHVDWIITHVDGLEVPEENGWAALVATREPDRTFTIRVKRPDKERAIATSLGGKVASYLRFASQRMVTAAASKTSPLHQDLTIYEEVPQGLAILLFSLFGMKSGFVIAVGAITVTKVIMTMVLRPYILAWQSMYSTWASVSPRDIERTVSVKCIRSAHMAGCCSSVASDCKQHPDTRAAALHGLRELLGRGDALEIDQYKLREVLTSKSVVQFDHLLAEVVAKPLFQDDDQLERNFRTVRRLYSAVELGEDDVCRIIDEMTPEMFVFWPIEPHIQALCEHASEAVRSAASKAMQALRKVLSEHRVPVAAAEVQAMPGQRFEGDGGQVHYEPGDKGVVVSDACVNAEGGVVIKVSWQRTGLTSEEMVKGWTERFKLVGRVYFSVGDVVEALPGTRCETKENDVVYESGDKGKVTTEPYVSPYTGNDVIDITWNRSGLTSFETISDCMIRFRVVEKAPSLTVGQEVEALPGQRLEGKELCPPPGKKDEGKGVVFYEPGDTGRVSSQYNDADMRKRIKVTWYRSGLTTEQSMTSWMDTFRVVGPPHSLSVGDEVEALPGSRAEGAEGAVHEPGDRGVVTRLPHGDERILITWYKTGLTGCEHVSAWIERLRFVGKARVPALGDEVEALPGKRFENKSGVVFFEPGDKGKVSTGPYVGDEGDEVIKIFWPRTGETSIESRLAPDWPRVENLLSRFRVVEAAGDAPGAQ